jgi:hypothetical protein
MTMAPRRAKESSSDGDSSGKASPDMSVADTFPCKAFQVIQYCENHDPDVACWNRDGSYFLVKDTAAFSASHLPRYFRHSNLQSFIRQLNIYGFRTVKDHDNSDGSVAFHHRFFKRDRRDLLSNITRTSKKQGGSYNDRFDEMQLQMDVLSEKLDRLISLVTAKSLGSPGDAIVGSEGIPLGKRRRKDLAGGSVLSHLSEITSSTRAESFHSSSSESSRNTVLSTLSETKEDTEDQDSLEGLKESSQDLDEIYQNAAMLKEGDDDFKMFIDEVLGGDEEADTVSDLPRQDIVRSTNVDEGEQPDAVSDRSRHDMLQTRSAELMEEEAWNNNSIENNDATVMAADHLMSKVTPETVQGQVHIPQSTAVVSNTSNDDEYDEEAGTPLATAVIATPDVSHKWLGRHAKIVVTVFVFMFLAAFITWPVVVFGGVKRKNLHYSISADDPADSENTTTTETEDETFGNKNALDSGLFAKSIEDDERNPLKLELSNGDKYECLVIHKPLKRRELFHHAL